MRKRDRLKIQNRLTAAILSMLLVITVTFTLSDFKPANAHSEDGMSPGGQNGIMKTEGDNIEILTHEGESCNKVVYAEDLTKKETKQLENEAELEPLVKEEGSNIYQADLTAKEEKALEKEDGVIVEDNMGFDASSVKKDKDAKKMKKYQNITEENDKVWLTSEGVAKLRKSYDIEWNFKMIRSEKRDKNKKKKISGDAVKIGLLDSGVDYITNEVNVAQAANFVETEQDAENMINDMTGHGSSVAYIISKINPDAKIYSAKVLDRNNEGTLSGVVSGIYWCIDNDVDIINMSFGTNKRSEILKKAIDEAKEAGILMYSSAGNEPSAGVEYPAKFSGVTAVGSVNEEGNKSDFSAEGKEVEVYAPGEGIVAQGMLGLYTEVEGTSISSPHVAAAASLLMEESNAKEDEHVREVINNSANCYNDEIKLIDIENAENSLDNSDNTRSNTENNKDPQKSEDTTVSGKWRTEYHNEIFDKANAAATSLSGNELKAMKKGATYPDTAKLTGKYAHGRRNINWIATYMYLTALGKRLREQTNVSSFSKPKIGEVFKYSSFANNKDTIAFVEKIREDMGAKAIYFNGREEPDDDSKWSSWFNNGKTYPWDSATVVTTEAGSKKPIRDFLLNDCGYSSASAAKQAKLKSLFVYGIALHTFTDAFAHAAYTSKATGNRIILHETIEKKYGKTKTREKYGAYITDADSPTCCPNRYADARHASVRVINHAFNNEVGLVTDFSPATSLMNTPRDYCLNRIFEKAKAIDGKEYTKQYKQISYTP